MGFFTDAYDLFIIGTVTVILTPIFNLSTNQISLLNSISLLASVVGAITFGKLMDRLGRKRMYGVEVTILVVGALLSALSWNFTSLMIFRVLVGLGVGGDYATSAVITAEYANRRSRGRLIGTVFAMQGFGLLAGPLIASIFLATGVSNGVAWRLMLALGAVPAASVIYLRRKIRETPRFTLAVKGDGETTAETLRWTLGDDASTRPVVVTPRASARARLTSKPFLKRLIGTAGAWFLLDIAYYGNSVSSPLILKTLQPNGTLLNHTLISLAIFTVCALPGYWVAVALLDKLGRRRIQIQGFLMMTAAYFVIALVPGVTEKVWVFLTLFGFSYFFVEFGPNMTTFVYPSEVFPTAIRGAGDGISAAAGKFGAFLGALFVPHLLNSMGVRGVMAVMASVSIVGAILTRLALPEPMGQTLEEASAEIFEAPLLVEPSSSHVVTPPRPSDELTH
ncbi:MAG: MFS transporter [Acidobacteriota bacterium]|nr:MFS transporter [Acidobacteriota bacterium]